MLDARALDAAIQLINTFEGCAKRRADGRLDAYPDPASGGAPWTIGWGTTGPDVKPGTIWNQSRADQRRDTEIARLAGLILKEAPATLPLQLAALVSFAYNLGFGALKDSTLFRLHWAGDVQAAQGQFGRWINAAGKPMPGLVRRRAAEAKIYSEAT